LFLLVGSFLLVSGLAVLLLLVCALLPVGGVALGHFVFLAGVFIFGLVLSDIVSVFFLALSLGSLAGNIVGNTVTLLLWYLLAVLLRNLLAVGNGVGLAVLFGDVLAMRNSVWCAVLFWDVVIFGNVDVVTLLLWDFLALLAVVV